MRILGGVAIGIAVVAAGTALLLPVPTPPGARGGLERESLRRMVWQDTTIRLLLEECARLEAELAEARAAAADPVAKDRRILGGRVSDLRDLPDEELFADLPHRTRTSGAQRSEIDECIALYLEDRTDLPSILSIDRLAQIGRPAVPRLIAAFRAAGRYPGPKGVRLACGLDGALRRIAGRPAHVPPLRAADGPTADRIRRTVRAWYVWWYSWGHIAH